MIKHIFTVFILLIGISTMVSGQTDTIPAILEDDTSKEVTETPDFVEKYKEYKGEYTTTASHVDSSRMNTKGLKWFIDCGTCDYFGSDENNWLEKDGFRELLQSFSIGLSIGASSVRVQDGFISPVLYGGNAYRWTLYFEGTSPRLYWRHTYSFGRGKISPLKLSPSFNREDYAFAYKPVLLDIEGALRIAKSPHYLGARLAVEGFTISSIGSPNFPNQELTGFIKEDVNNDILLLGISHLYFNEFFEIPFRTKVSLSVLKSSSYPYGDTQFKDFNHTFKIDFMLNKKRRTKLMVGYMWNIFHQDKADKFYETTKSSSSLSLTWVL